MTTPSFIDIQYVGKMAPRSRKIDRWGHYFLENCSWRAR
jgi:hypothetical protein